MNIKPYIILESGMSLEASAQFFGMSQDEIKKLVYYSPNNDMLIHGMNFVFSRKINDDNKARFNFFLEALTGVDIEKKLINKEELDDKDKRKVLRYMIKYACSANVFNERFNVSEHFIEILIGELEKTDVLKKLSMLKDYNKDLYMNSFKKN